MHWASNENIPLRIEGAGLVDCHLYTQKNYLILHLVNLTNAATWRQPLDELIAIGPLKVTIQMPKGIAGNKIQTLVSNKSIAAKVSDGQFHFELSSILDHEVIVIG